MHGLIVLVLACMLMAGPQTATAREAGALLQASAGKVQRPAFKGAGRDEERESMVRTQIARRGVRDPAVLAALSRVPRHAFVPPAMRARAYDDSPLPIGHGQTISQPYIVGFMTEMLALRPEHRVLEVGTGSGYQAAILAEIVERVVSMEIVAPLARATARRMQEMGFSNLTLRSGDGYFGWPAEGPYDAIIVTAAAGHVPPPLIAQLKPGGRMAIPVGESAWTQNLLLVEKDADGGVTTRNLMAVRFVPLTGGH